MIVPEAIAHLRDTLLQPINTAPTPEEFNRILAAQAKHKMAIDTLERVIEGYRDMLKADRTR